jgi:hypothetical protein
MGYALLWIENLAAALLLGATLLACAGKTRLPRFGQVLLGVVGVLFPLAAFVAILAFEGYLKSEGLRIGVVFPLQVSAIFYALGGAGMLIRGLRRNAEAPKSIHARRWPAGRLTAVLVVVVILHAITFSSLDTAVKQQLTSLRSEAGALALSVAPPRVADAENAALVYQHFFDAVDTNDWPMELWESVTEDIDSPRRPDANETAFDYSSAELGEFLEQVAGELAVIRQAAKLPECRFERDYGRPSYEMLIPEQAHMRRAARLLAIDARHKAATGDSAGAVEDINAIFAMARHVSSEPLLITTLVSMAIHGRGINTLEELMTAGAVTAKDLENLQLPEDVSYRRSMARALRMEEATGLSLFCDANGKLSSNFVEIAGFRDVFELVAVYRVFNLAEDLAMYREHFRKLHRALSAPYHATRDEWRKASGSVRRGEAGVLTTAIASDLTQIAVHSQRGEAQHRAAVLGVAIFRYYDKHGRPPESLDDLSPEFVKIVPRDPFDGKAMRLKFTDQGCVIYGIGPDLVDNGGSPLRGRKDAAVPVQRAEGDVPFVVKLPSGMSDAARPAGEETRADDSRESGRASTDESRPDSLALSCKAE